jgi:hypothetical protein
MRSRREVVLLTEAGEKTLDRFNGYINEAVDQLIAAVPEISPRALAWAMKRFQSHADGIRQAARQMATDRAAGADDISVEFDEVIPDDPTGGPSAS